MLRIFLCEGYKGVLFIAWDTDASAVCDISIDGS